MNESSVSMFKKLFRGQTTVSLNVHAFAYFNSGTDSGFFLGGGAPPRNGIADW